ncbi:Gfo/Idh/MocA family protein [Deinococcus cellulosilyticus]|uniref:Oxidoreductase n=1 Tax=Deinococcus cellulosilyticus (strain DSM 18568 / NBRC 106333 / KACC 11606 / 5516J-15) TaxID=1223518 RepID=A0A511N5V9_DEIC1|nr:Gfo/Idh/MocA family oxidoreductase [Deinococcus cellulosilyticus]GEM47858.1 oxidoreductase [Deinococcus cellulosilyticus NBRC 106333 = KACC 11606]
MNWGILGAANIAQKALIPAIREAGSTVYAVAARNPERARDYAERNQIPHALTYDELLGHPDIDIIYNPLPNSEHLPLTLRALEQGKHVLCEKPLTLNASEVRTMMEAEKASGKVVMEAFFYRFHPQIQRLLEIVQSGTLGDLQILRSAFTFHLGNPDDIRWDPKLGGGAFYDVGCYCVDIMRLVAGKLPESIDAVAQFTASGVDHTTSALLNFGSFVGHADASFNVPFEQSFTLIGTQGTVHLNAPFVTAGQNPTLTLNGAPETFEEVNGYAEMVRHFERAVRGEEGVRYPLGKDSLEQATLLDEVLRKVGFPKV